MDAFFDMLWLYIKLLLLIPIFCVGIVIVMGVALLIINGVLKVLGYIFIKLDVICTKNIILQKIWNTIVTIGMIIIILGFITLWICMGSGSCNVNRYDDHLEWYKK